MYSDWLTFLRRARPDAAPAPSPPNPDAVLSLAAGVQQLCVLCEDLLALVPPQELPTPLLRAIPEQLDAVRACADDIRSREFLRAAASAVPECLAAPGPLVWREPSRA